MFCGNVAGDVLSPYVIFKSKHLYHEWTLNGPKNARYNRTKSSWFDEVTFQDWFFSMLLPKLRKQDGKTVIIGDNLSSHLSEEVIEACNKNNITFLCLFPNATHLQPLDAAFFAPLKKIWRELLRKWRITPRGRKVGTLPKEDFSMLLNKLMKELLQNSKRNLKSGFRTCGLVPFNPNEVYAKLASENTMSPSKAIDSSILDHLRELLGEDDEEGPSQRKHTRLEVEPGKSVVVPADSEESNSDGDDVGNEVASCDEESDVESDVESASGSESDGEVGENDALKKKILSTWESLSPPHSEDEIRGTWYACIYNKTTGRREESFLFVGQVLRRFLNGEEGPVCSVELRCLKHKVGSGTKLQSNPSHLAHDDYVCSIQDIIAGPLEVHPVHRSSKFNIPYYEVVKLYNITKKMPRYVMLLKAMKM